MDIIDLRHDALIRPTEEMRNCMLTVEVGDDVYSDDPTVNLLEKQVAELLGKEASCLVPTSLFANQCAVLAYTRPGDQVIVAEESHLIQAEYGSMARISRVLTKTIKTHDGLLKLKEVAAAIRTDLTDIHSPITTLMMIENPTFTGRVYPVEEAKQLYETAHSRGVHVHLDSSRIFHACAQLNIQPKQLTKYADSVTVCLEKGLYASMGSCVAGSHEFIDRLRKARKILGGGLRQAGFIAGPALVALKSLKNVPVEDNLAAKMLAEQLSKLSWIEIVQKVETSMVIFRVLIKALEMSKLSEFMKRNGILMEVPRSVDLPIRIVTNRHIRAKEMEQFIQKLQEFVQSYIDAA